jgi:DGQHR domain-containing protein
MLDSDRLKNIAAKLKDKSLEANFPNNIIASVDIGDCSFRTLENEPRFGVLELKNQYGSLRIVDGQHRLYSFLYAKDLKDSFDLAVGAFLNLSQEEQSVIFASINYYAKRVTPDLIDYLFSLETKRSALGSAAVICRKLSDEDSIFGDDRLFLGYEKSRKGRYIGLHSIVRVLIGDRYNLISEKCGRIQKNKGDEETPRRILRDYFVSIANNFNADWVRRKDGFVKTSNGIGVFLGLLSRMAMRESLDKLNRNTFDKYLRRLARTRWQKYREMELTSEGARWEVINQLSKKMKLD